MDLSFLINAWRGFAPGIQSHAEWCAWARSPHAPVGECIPELPGVPAMARRRLSALGKMAVAAADAVMQGQDGDVQMMPVVWASRYGDADRSLALLAEQARWQPLSPAGFGLSVHNGIGAQHSILRGVRANGVCVAAGRHTVEAGVVEAVSLLHDGAPSVLLVCYDAPLPGDYAVFHDEPPAAYAWAASLSLQPMSPKAARFTLSCGDSMHAQAFPNGHDLPHGLEVLQYIASGRQAFSNCNWHWRRGG